MSDESFALAPTWPPPDEAIRDALMAAYADGSWAKYDGRHAAALVAALGQLTTRRHVQLCSSGTIAVELALRGLKVGPGDEVLIAAYDFPGNFRAIESVGATPVLVDLAPHSWRIDLHAVEEAIGKTTRAIIASHLHGDLLDMPRLCDIAAARGLALLEDACQVPGATVHGRPAGNWGDAGVFSFGGSKLLTAGRGGAIVTDRDDIAQRIKIANDRGNLAYPLSELQAAVLLPQSETLGERNHQRLASVRQLLAQAERFVGLRSFQEPTADDSLPAFYKLPFRVADPPPEMAAEKWRDLWIARLQQCGLAVDAGFRGFFRRSSARCRRVGDLTNSQAAAERTLLLHHPVLLQPASIIDQVADVLAQTSATLSFDQQELG